MGRSHRHVSIDYYAYCSGIRDWNSSYKVIFSTAALITVITADKIPVSLATVGYMMFLTVVLGKVRVQDYIRLLLVPAAFIALSGLAIAVQPAAVSEAVRSVRIFGATLSVTRNSLLLAASTGIKALGAVSCLYFMTLSTPMGEVLSFFRKIHVPQLILELMHLIYRYIFLLSEMNRRQKDAARARLGYHGFRTSMRTFGLELANLFVLSMKKSGIYYDAMVSRGYADGCLFWEEEKPFFIRQFFPCLLYGGIVLLLFLW